MQGLDQLLSPHHLLWLPVVHEIGHCGVRFVENGVHHRSRKVLDFFVFLKVFPTLLCFGFSFFAIFVHDNYVPVPYSFYSLHFLELDYYIAQIIKSPRIDVSGVLHVIQPVQPHELHELLLVVPPFNDLGHQIPLLGSLIDRVLV